MLRKLRGEGWRKNESSFESVSHGLGNSFLTESCAWEQNLNVLLGTLWPITAMPMEQTPFLKGCSTHILVSRVEQADEKPVRL